jgi:predicted RNA-binding Zn-ribbon protein involved in translation (DUF1610 family)
VGRQLPARSPRGFGVMGDVYALSCAHDGEILEAEGDGVKYAHRIICPMCGVHELRPHSRNSTRCPRCGPLERAFLKTLFQINALPDAIGAHACDCGHPVMRRLPDHVYRCPACGLEVVSVSSPRSGRSPQP